MEAATMPDQMHDACWSRVAHLQETGALEFATVDSKPLSSFSELEPVMRGKLLYALAEASLGARRSSAPSQIARLRQCAA